jgi:hypothetical protein
VYHPNSADPRAPVVFAIIADVWTPTVFSEAAKLAIIDRRTMNSRSEMQSD